MGQIKVEKNVGGIEGLHVITPTVHGDERGYFLESYNERDMREQGIDVHFVQDNQSMSVKGVLRGLHFQIQHPQCKLVRTIRGEVFDVVVDLRPGSATWGKWHGEILSEENRKQFLIPAGFAHGFLVLSDSAEFCYKVDDFWHPHDEGGIAWNDPAIGICWPGVQGTYQGSASAEGYMMEDGTPLILSDRDQKWDTLPGVRHLTGDRPGVRHLDGTGWNDSVAKKVWVTGVCGQLGYDVASELLRRGYAVVGSDIKEPEDIQELPDMGAFDFVQMDICDSEAVRSNILEESPDAVIHCAAWTAVDAAEDPANADKVFDINVQGTRNIASAVRELDEAKSCKMVYISTDYVFDGHGSDPWEPDCREFGPVNVYGRTKLQGEQCVEELLEKFFVVRTSWVFGKHGNNFVKTMIKLGRTHDELRVVRDQMGTPTYTPDLARLLVDMIATEKYGYYHATNQGGFVSWYDFACEILRLAGLQSVRVIPVTTEEYGLSKALRPYNSRMDKSKLRRMGFEPLPHWQDALRSYIGELEKI